MTRSKQVVFKLFFIFRYLVIREKFSFILKSIVITDDVHIKCVSTHELETIFILINPQSVNLILYI